MSVVEQQGKELRVDAARGAEGCGHEADAVIVSIVRLILRSFFPGSFLQRLVDHAGWPGDEACSSWKGRPYRPTAQE